MYIKILKSDEFKRKNIIFFYALFLLLGLCGKKGRADGLIVQAVRSEWCV
jgi:hypothetical protein